MAGFQMSTEVLLSNSTSPSAAGSRPHQSTHSLKRVGQNKLPNWSTSDYRNQLMPAFALNIGFLGSYDLCGIDSARGLVFRLLRKEQLGPRIPSRESAGPVQRSADAHTPGWFFPRPGTRASPLVWAAKSVAPCVAACAEPADPLPESDPQTQLWR
jgi:hypothetical protein